MIQREETQEKSYDSVIYQDVEKHVDKFKHTFAKPINDDLSIYNFQDLSKIQIATKTAPNKMFDLVVRWKLHENYLIENNITNNIDFRDQDGDLEIALRQSQDTESKSSFAKVELFVIIQILFISCCLLVNFVNIALNLPACCK